MKILGPWEQLLWIAALAMILAPLIIMVWNSMCNGYFRAKENHIGKLAKAFATVLESTLKDATEKMKARMEAKKNEHKADT